MEEIAVHADIESTPQSIYFPEIGTKASCPETDSQMAPAKKELTITDTVGEKENYKKEEILEMLDKIALAKEQE